MKKLSIGYFGTPDFSVHFLKKLLEDDRVTVEFVVTQEDKKVGRKQILTSTPVKIIGQKFELSPLVWSKGYVNQNDKRYEQLQLHLKTVDVALVYAFGEMIPAEFLDLPKYGFWNVHPSLLPKYRGPSPVAQVLIDGEEETGVTLIKLDEKMDHGPIIAQEKLKIEPKERRPELTIRLTELAYEMFTNVVRSLPNFFDDAGYPAHPSQAQDRPPKSQKNWQPRLKPQDHSKATYTKLLKKSDGFMELSNLKLKIKNSPEKLFNLFRGLYQWPGIWTKIKTKNLELRTKITDMDFVDGKLIIKKVQLEGKKEVDFATFNVAYGKFF